MIEDEMEYWMNKYDSIKELYSNTLDSFEVLNQN